ncbi:MAG: lysophospholipid acyltransferase family protein [Phycisphaeraceae bacterium]|nr:lysophospholipid acyltransferase family protein [Phycisphaeraceae bacterium]
MATTSGHTGLETTPEARAVLERRSSRMIRGFNRYLRWYLSRHLRQVAILDDALLPDLAGRAAVIHLNHPSWWDPLIVMLLADQLLPKRRHFGPLDAEALKKYRVFEKLGVFGVDQESASGARAFLRIAQGLLADPEHVIWITAEGAFTDPRRRPIQLRPGISHLARSMPEVAFIPMALELVYWQERTPEALIAFGEPIVPASNGSEGGESVEAWTRRLAENQQAIQDRLASVVMERDDSRFLPVLVGRTGVGGFYDFWRRIKSFWRGERFDPSHAAGLRRRSGERS